MDKINSHREAPDQLDEEYGAESEFERAILTFEAKNYSLEEQKQFFISLIEIHKQELRNIQNKYRIILMEKENTNNQLKSHLENMSSKNEEIIEKISQQLNLCKTQNYKQRQKNEEETFKQKINHDRELFEKQKLVQELEN